MEMLINEIESTYKTTELINVTTIQIHSTTNYDMLKTYKSNRLVSKAHVKNIADSMKLYGNTSVGLVAELNGVLYIVDGQHRCTACRTLGIPFDYKKITIKDSDELVKFMSSINNKSKKWKDIDYLNAWASEGKKSYQWVQEVNNDFKSVTFSNLINIVGWSKKDFQDGTWSITKKEFFKAMRVVRNLDNMISVFKELGMSTRAQLLRAPISAMLSPNYNHTKMVKVLREGKGTWSNDEVVLRTELLQEVSYF
jgi:hypothetical protein